MKNWPKAFENLPKQHLATILGYKNDRVFAVPLGMGKTLIQFRYVLSLLRFCSSVFPVAEGEIRRSYTPHAEGEVPAMVMEFLSETDGGEYSLKPLYPYGKWWFYE